MTNEQPIELPAFLSFTDNLQSWTYYKITIQILKVELLCTILYNINVYVVSDCTFAYKMYDASNTTRLQKKVKVQKHTCQCMVQENVEMLQSR